MRNLLPVSFNPDHFKVKKCDLIHEEISKIYKKRSQ